MCSCLRCSATVSSSDPASISSVFPSLAPKCGRSRDPPAAVTRGDVDEIGVMSRWYYPVSSNIAALTRRTGRLLLPQHPLRRVVQVVELPPAGGEDQQGDEHAAEPERRAEQDEDPGHRSSLRTAGSTRSEVQITTALESGMMTAATRGVTSPATAAATDTRL